MKIKKIIGKYKPQITFGAVTVLAVLVCALYIVPAIQTIWEQWEQIDEVTKKNEVLSKKINLLAQTELSGLENKYQLVNGILLKDKNPYRIFSIFDDAISKIDAKNLSLGKIDFSPGEMKKTSVKKTAAGNVMFDVLIKGKYETFLELVKQIETNYPLMSVSATSGKLPDAEAELNANFVVYVVPEIEFIPSLETPLTEFSQEDASIFDKATLLQKAPASEVPFIPQKFNREDIF